MTAAQPVGAYTEAMAATAVAVCAILFLASLRHEATAATKTPEQVAIAATGESVLSAQAPGTLRSKWCVLVLS